MIYRLGFVMETTLGHNTTYTNLKNFISKQPDVDPAWMPVRPWEDDRSARTPLVRNNYALTASLRAHDMVTGCLRQERLDALVYNTQSAALLSLGLARRLPTIVMMDATPVNMDRIAGSYNHRPASFLNPMDLVKLRWDRRIFESAGALIVYSQWAADSVIRDYGIDPAKVSVIPLGMDLRAWRPSAPRANGDDNAPAPAPAPATPRPLRILFVGGDFPRKGGPMLLDLFRSGLAEHCELDLVTGPGAEAVASEGPIRVHRGLTSNSPELRRLYDEADLFVLPTLGDCNSSAILEAMASGLPVVSTATGAIPELIDEGETGYVVPTGDPDALARAVRSLVDGPALRARFGAAGRRRAERYFNADRNFARMLDVYKRCVDDFDDAARRRQRAG